MNVHFADSFPGGAAFPPGVNPETYRLAEVTAFLREAAYFVLFTAVDPSHPNVPIFDRRGRIIAVLVNEEPHGFDLRPVAPDWRGVRAVNRVGRPVGNVHIRWTPCPEDFVEAPGREPPPTALDPRSSQRFVMLDGRLTLRDRAHSGFEAFGTGRTFPMSVGDRMELGLGASIDVLRGYGALAGLRATNVVNGYIEPPDGLVLTFLLRAMDPARRLHRGTGAARFIERLHPAPETTVLGCIGEPDPDEPTRLIVGSDGSIRGSHVVERLRLVRLSYDIAESASIRTRLLEGPIVGRAEGTLQFNPFTQEPNIPIRTTDGVFTFFDRSGAVVGTLFADVADGRAYPTDVAGLPLPIFRFGGFGPCSGGGGTFAGLSGMMSLNAAVSVFPRTLSNFYLFRLNDPDGRCRATLGDAWF